MYKNYIYIHNYIVLHLIQVKKLKVISNGYKDLSKKQVKIIIIKYLILNLMVNMFAKVFINMFYWAEVTIGIILV